MEKFQRIVGTNKQTKILRLNTLKRVRGTVSLYLRFSSPRVAQLKDKKTFLAGGFSHGENESM